MEIKSTDLISLFERSLVGDTKEALEEVGTVIQVRDTLCLVHGLSRAVYAEFVRFEGGNEGIILGLDEDCVSVFLLHSAIAVVELEMVKRTGQVLMISVGHALAGRVVNALAKPIDGLGDIDAAAHRPIESSIPGVIAREPINRSLETGITAIDALVPIGRGQRELIIGNRATGKTSIAIDAIIHQKDKQVRCVYVAIGQRQANVARIVRTLEEHGALSYTTVVVADPSEAVLNQYIAPYTGCTIAEYFRDAGQDVLIVYDDLSNHAVAFREMSLLLRRAPGREAYPGDVFYLHSRLLERAGRVVGSGSITALPIVQIQSDDITAYIPTNLISITDGQILLDSTLFNQGVRPAVNAELSVSRVGGAAQVKAMRQVVRTLKLDLAQYHDLLDFAQFGSELDEVSQQRLKRGARVIELLKQPQHVTYSFVDQVLMLFLLQQGLLDTLEIVQVQPFTTQFVSYVRSIKEDLYETILRDQAITDEILKVLSKVADEFATLFAASTGKALEI